MNKCKNCDGMLVFEVDDFQAIVNIAHDQGIAKEHDKLEAKDELISKFIKAFGHYHVNNGFDDINGLTFDRVRITARDDFK